MIKIIGTTHLTSKEAIEGMIKDESPEIIGVELCETRFKALTGQIAQGSGSDGTLVGDITDSIKKKAEEQNLDYGSDMKTAMFYAMNNNIQLALVDKDITEIQSDMSKIPVEEQLFLQQELVKFQEENLNQKVDEEQVLRSMRENIPTAYKYLVEDRNKVIANKLIGLSIANPDKKILVFLGSGHVKQVEELLR